MRVLFQGYKVRQSKDVGSQSTWLCHGYICMLQALCYGKFPRSYLVILAVLKQLYFVTNLQERHFIHIWDDPKCHHKSSFSSPFQYTHFISRMHHKNEIMKLFYLFLPTNQMCRYKQDLGTGHFPVCSQNPLCLAAYQLQHRYGTLWIQARNLPIGHF